MLMSLASLILLGLTLASISKRFNLPRIIGLLITGMILGPCVLDFLDPKLLSISTELRQIALIIILLKAGLSLNFHDLKQVGRPAILLSFLPASIEILAYVIVAPRLLKITPLEAALLGTVLAAVSPAVVVPRMVNLLEKGSGIAKSIPQLILAGASCDDIFVIVLFSSFLPMVQGGKIHWMDFTSIPLVILSGVLAGAIVGSLLAKFFEVAYEQGNVIRNSLKVVIILGVSFLLMGLEGVLRKPFVLSGLLAIVTMATVLKMKCIPAVHDRLWEKFGKLWLAAELILFVLVGAAVDLRFTLKAGIWAIVLILIALVFRSLGVLLSLTGTNLTRKERLFTILAYLPKATVQAAIGSVPLSLGLPCGKIILSVAVLAILITAPLGALAMDRTYHKLLSKNQT